MMIERLKFIPFRYENLRNLDDIGFVESCTLIGREIYNFWSEKESGILID